jgi:hypothetical protein
MWNRAPSSDKVRPAHGASLGLLQPPEAIAEPEQDKFWRRCSFFFLGGLASSVAGFALFCLWVSKPSQASAWPAALLESRLAPFLAVWLLHRFRELVVVLFVDFGSQLVLVGRYFVFLGAPLLVAPLCGVRDCGVRDAGFCCCCAVSVGISSVWLSLPPHEEGRPVVPRLGRSPSLCGCHHSTYTNEQIDRLLRKGVYRPLFRSSPPLICRPLLGVTTSPHRIPFGPQRLIGSGPRA